MNVLDVNLYIVHYFRYDRPHIRLLPSPVSISSFKRRDSHTFIPCDRSDLAGGIINSLCRLQLLLLRSLFYPGVLFQIHLALWPRSRQNIHIINDYLDWLILQLRPRNRY